MDAAYNPDKGLPNPENQEAKNMGNVIGGYKASLNNPGHSEEAKEHDKEMLQKLEQQGHKGYGEIESTPVDKQ